MSIWNKKYDELTLGELVKATGIITLASIGISGALAFVCYGINEGWFEKKKTELYTTVADDTEEDEG